MIWYIPVSLVWVLQEEAGRMTEGGLRPEKLHPQNPKPHQKVPLGRIWSPLGKALVVLNDCFNTGG